MDRIKLISVVVNAILIIIVIAGLILHFNYPEIKIVKTTETKTEYIKVPVTLEEYKNCYDSPLNIDGTAKNNSLVVVCGDDCKTKSKTFYLTVKNDLKRSFIFSPVVGYSFTGMINYGGEVQFFYRLFDRFSLGGGIEILTDGTKISNINIKPSIVVHF